ncbi:hypothetical protein ILYODFUR_038913 [Ilyodon furcidens]|uniref:Uncharacterized protein n=1 Tax=Ilyodon furcidens TaxID=33524 RepID=A0ABV0T4Y2_9TELE
MSQSVAYIICSANMSGDYREVWKGMLQEPTIKAAEKQQDFVFSFEMELARFYTDGKLQKRALNLLQQLGSFIPSLEKIVGSICSGRTSRRLLQPVFLFLFPWFWAVSNLHVPVVGFTHL